MFSFFCWRICGFRLDKIDGGEEKELEVGLELLRSLLLLAAGMLDRRHS